MDVGAFFRGRPGLWRIALLVWTAIALLLLTKGQIWTGLHKLDTDDAMRLVQVRDWLGGQAWLDVDQHRGWPAPGFSIHWSRIPDLAIGGLISFFALVLPSGGAETAAMVVWPLAQLLVAIALVGAAARRLAGAPAMAPAMLMFALMGPVFWQFQPGRIDHHGLQLIGVLIMVVAVMNLRRGALAGVAAGLGGALSLAVGLEGLIFWLALCAIAGLVLVRDGVRARSAVTGLGLTVALATPVLAFATNPTRYVASQVCDQAAWPVLALAATGGLGLALVAAASGAFRTPAARLAAVAAVGLAAAAAYGWAGPDCLRGPFANVDPRLGPIWLDHIQEARTLPWLLRRLDPFGVASAVISVMAAAALGYVMRHRPGQLRAIAVVGLMLAAAVAMLFVQMRGITYTVAFACPVLAAALVTAARRAGVSRRDWGAVMLASLIAIIGAPQAARELVGLVKPKPVVSAAEAAEGCFDPARYGVLAALEPGLAVAPIDSGPFILMASPLSVLSAPYHRNAEGILAAQRVLEAPPVQAREIAEGLGVRYVVMCRSGAVLRLKRLAPDSLAAALDMGQAPDWLEAATAGPGPVRAYRVR